VRCEQRTENPQNDGTKIDEFFANEYELRRKYQAVALFEITFPTHQKSARMVVGCFLHAQDAKSTKRGYTQWA
jgi:hypothetical protein